MTWWQFSLNCQASELELVEELMLELGAVSISLRDAGDEPIYEPLPGDNPVWQESIVTATFDQQRDPGLLRQQLIDRLPAHLADGVQQEGLQDQAWDQAYKQHFKPLQCAPDLWIVPSWSEPPDPAATIIQLDPGLAFGTGTHPTTALCLAWLGSSDVDGSQVIDFGCGSGILAIAAIKLGAKHVTAVDIDEQALVACRSNMKVNAIGTEQIFVGRPEDAVSTGADLLMANILARPLIESASRFASMVRPEGQILLSGILKTQLEDIQLAYQPFFELDPARYRDQWVCVSGKRL
ncbi:MAG: 50S ribosomal protein L11 methyltransferase [Gammaproteobacteria bacterium]|nr:50S ribosomal protein L11 methyltransferase [Gammaproteobacteria bacterium]